MTVLSATFEVIEKTAVSDLQDNIAQHFPRSRTVIPHTGYTPHTFMRVEGEHASKFCFLFTALEIKRHLYLLKDPKYLERVLEIIHVHFPDTTVKVIRSSGCIFLQIKGAHEPHLKRTLQTLRPLF